jgi:hypothetical protein
MLEQESMKRTMQDIKYHEQTVEVRAEVLDLPRLVDTCSRLGESGGVGRTCATVFYGRLQAAGGLPCSLERPADRGGGQGAEIIRCCVAPLGGAAWDRARADGYVCGASSRKQRRRRQIKHPRSPVCSGNASGCGWSDILRRSIAIFAGVRT